MRMEYSKLRNKVGKFYNGGEIQKLQPGGNIDWMGIANKQQKNLGITNPDVLRYVAGNGQLSNLYIQGKLTQDQAMPLMQADQDSDLSEEERNQTNLNQLSTNIANGHPEYGAQTEQEFNHASEMSTELAASSSGDSGDDGTAGATGGFSSVGMGMIAQAGVGAMKAVDNLAMGDKNFGAQSQAIDSAVHGVSSALMSSGNPYAMAAGAALEGANFLTKAGGQTVQGFDVNIENSGFGTLGHMESSSSRDFGAMIGLGGLNTGKIQAKLARRNEQARMALQAAEISEDVKFEQEARMNSVDNVLRNNQIALAGGIDTSLLGS